MQFPWLPILPLLHILSLVVLVSSIVYMKKHAALGGALALIAAVCAVTTAIVFVVLFRGGF